MKQKRRDLRQSLLNKALDPEIVNPIELEQTRKRQVVTPFSQPSSAF